MWQNQLKKDIVSHTSFIGGVQPKGASDISTLEDLAMKYIKARIRHVKETPSRLTGYIRPYGKEIVAPRAKKLMEQNPELTFREAIKQSYSRIEWIKYAMKRNVDSVLNR